jgi:hypothetical protein
MARCAGTKPTGEPCERIVGASQRYCYAHDPAYTEERRKAASKAARSRHDPEVRQIKASLKDLSAGVLDGTVDRGRAAVANQVFNILLRAIEVERRVREHDELEGRLDELEALLEEAERSTTYARR